MTLANVQGSKLASLSGRSANGRGHAVGERVTLRVLQRLGDHHYLVALRDSQRVVNSSMPLTVGSTVRATVSAVGDKLELKYSGAETHSRSDENTPHAADDTLSELAAQYAIELRADQRLAIEQALEGAENPEAMAAAGLFLCKLSLPLEGANLKALYGAQSWQESGVISNSADAVSVEAGTTSALAEQLLSAMHANSGDAQPGDADSDRDFARKLLNEQDEGSVGHRYGLLPMLIGDQLMELDLVYFRERRPAQEGHSRRLIMTFQAPTLGRVEVQAQAINDRLTIAIRTDSNASRDILAARAGEVRELIARLGWQVDGVEYEFSNSVERAAHHVLDHVLNAETFSKLV